MLAARTRAFGQHVTVSEVAVVADVCVDGDHAARTALEHREDPTRITYRTTVREEREVRPR